ncbi:tetratricopeptide repeat protein [Candidatus Poribacteria bacterium]|nr:tetratricopeptide repeat protein [Candidatus Poribacteria bacterium]
MNETKGELIQKIYFICIFLIILLSFHDFAGAQAFKRFKEGDAVKSINLKTVEGIDINTENFKNKNVLGVIFWKYPNTRCESALKYMQNISNEYSENFGLKIFSVYCPSESKAVTSNEIDIINKIKSENNINIPVLLDDELKIFNSYGIISLPSIMIINKEGKAEYILAGFPKFGAEQDIKKNLMKILGIPEDVVDKKKYEPKSDADRNYKLATAVHSQGNTEKAKDYLLKAIEIDPLYPAPYSILGKLYIQKEDNKKAIENYQKSLELDPDNAKLMLGYGFLCLEAGMTEDALLVFKKTIEKFPDYSASGYYGLGTIYLKNNILDSAKEASEKADELYLKFKSKDSFEKINQAQNTANLAEIHYNFNDKSKAITSYKNAMEKYNVILTEFSQKNDLLGSAQK